MVSRRDISEMRLFFLYLGLGQAAVKPGGQVLHDQMYPSYKGELSPVIRKTRKFQVNKKSFILQSHKKTYQNQNIIKYLYLT